MIYVLAANNEECERWRKSAGLAPRNVHRIGRAGGRGRLIDSRDVVMLPGFESKTPAQQISAIRAALVPCGVNWSRIHRVRSAASKLLGG